jgi:outer membrane biosynthesis protein TonB
VRTGITISTFLHVGALFAVYYGVPELLDRPVIEEHPIIVDLVTIAEETISQRPPEPTPKETEKVKEPPPEPPKPEPKKSVAAPPPPPPPQASPPVPDKPKAVAMPEPEVPKEKPKLRREVVPLPKPVPVTKPKPPKADQRLETTRAFRTMPKPRSKPKPRHRRFSTDRIAALLDKDQEKKRTESSSNEPARKTAPSTPAVARTLDDRLSMSEMDAIINAIKQQIHDCWSITAGARNAADLKVRIKFFLNSDGSVEGNPEIISSPRDDDPFYQAAADSARRAVLSCSPFRGLPVKKYTHWRELILTFDPREVMGG